MASDIEMNNSVISRLLARHRHTGTVKDHPRSGQPRKTTRREDHYLNRRQFNSEVCGQLVFALVKELLFAGVESNSLV